MNQIEIGNLIAKARKEKGYTQKQLADFMFVTDKAVSKWERGLASPDSSLLIKLSLFLDIDVDKLVISENSNSNRIGVLKLQNDLYKQKIDGKPLIYISLMYFALLKITDLYIEVKDSEFIKSLQLEEFGFNVSFLKPKTDAKYLIIKDVPFIFGADLTKLLDTYLLNPVSIQLNRNNNDPLPIQFINEKVKFDKISNVELINKRLGRGYVSLIVDHSNIDDLKNFLNFYKKYHSFEIGNLREIYQNRNK